MTSKLQKQENRFTRTVDGTMYSSVDKRALLKELRWLNVRQFIAFVTTVMIHKLIHSNALPYLSERFTREKKGNDH